MKLDHTFFVIFLVWVCEGFCERGIVYTSFKNGRHTVYYIMWKFENETFCMYFPKYLNKYKNKLIKFVKIHRYFDYFREKASFIS